MITFPKVVGAAKRNKVDGVMTLASDMPIRSVAVDTKELGLVGITNETALKAINKAEIRKALSEYEVPVQKFLKVSNRTEYEKAVAQFGVPFIVKPADNSGSCDIFKMADLNDAQIIHDTYEYSRDLSRSGGGIVEEYMNGPEVSVEKLSINEECHVI